MVQQITHPTTDQLYRSFRENLRSNDFTNHDFGQIAPASLDGRLSYSSDSFNPVTSLLSALAHADWWHVIGNLIFFIAFAPALEILVGNALKFLGILVLIEFVCDATFSLALLGSPPVSTLGLSGIVMNYGRGTPVAHTFMQTMADFGSPVIDLSPSVDGFDTTPRSR